MNQDGLREKERAKHGMSWTMLGVPRKLRRCDSLDGEQETLLIIFLGWTALGWAGLGRAEHARVGLTGLGMGWVALGWEGLGWKRVWKWVPLGLRRHNHAGLAWDCAGLRRAGLGWTGLRRTGC